MSCIYGHCSLRMDPLQFQNAVPKRLVHLLRQDFCLSKIFFLRNLHPISPRITWCHCDEPSNPMWAWPSQHMPTVSRYLTAFCWHQWLFLWAQLELCHTFLKCHYFHSQTPRLPDFTLPDSLSSAWSCWAFCRPSSSACCFFASFSSSQDDNKTTKLTT